MRYDVLSKLKNDVVELPFINIVSLVLIVLVLFPVQVVKVDGKIVSFLVKKFGFVCS